MQIFAISDSNLAIIGVFSLVLLILLMYFGWSGVRDIIPYLKENKGPRKGIVLAILAFILFVLATSRCSALDVEMAIGIDDTGKPSPQCTPEGGWSQSLTSNIALRAKLIKYDSLQLLLTRTHHSCVFNQDKNTFDATEIALRLPVTANFELSASIGYNSDLKSYLTRRSMSYFFFRSVDHGTKIGLNLTQIGFSDRSLESTHGYLGAGITILYKTSLF